MTRDRQHANPPVADLAVGGRRRFLKLLALLAVGGRTLLRTGDARAFVEAARALARADVERPAMTYRPLGRTGWNASRLVFGCGAALASGRRDELLDAAFAAGINVFDVGFRGYYRDAERNLAPFLARRRDDVFLISKAIPSMDAGPGVSLSTAQRKDAAAAWARHLDDSLTMRAP